MKTAVFLGAGASKAFGYPLTTELLPRLLTRLGDDRLFEGSNPKRVNTADRAWFSARLVRLMPGLKDAWAAATKDDGRLAVSITDVLTLVDRALLHGEARALMPPEELGRFRQLLERAIYESLLRDNDRRTAEGQQNLDAFFSWLRRREGTAGVLTTNYDTAVDSRIFRHVSPRNSAQREARVARAVDLGFSWRAIETGELVARPAVPRWQVFKLHGSVNWLRCTLCGQIYVNVHGAVGSKAFTVALDEWNTCHCNDWARLRLHLVTPSLVRQTNDSHLLGIWQAGLELLRTADEWVIVGYSLPPEDVAIRTLFLRAWDGRRRKPRVVVVQRENAVTEQVYRAFFPRRHLTYLRSGLEGFLAAKD
jgi:NAD-dependent SIR2 family protein deacetylase